MRRGFKPLFVIPHEKEREGVEETVGGDCSIVFITTPGQVLLPSLRRTMKYLFLSFDLVFFMPQLAALIDDSAGVVATNTAAVQLANARQKSRFANRHVLR